MLNCHPLFHAGKSTVLNRHPVAHLVCNQSPPGADGAPSLMTFREVETLFHEVHVEIPVILCRHYKESS